MRQLFVVLLLAHTSLLSGQPTFNTQHHFDRLVAIGQGIHVTDSCYFFSGLIVDTIGNRQYDGLVFGRMNTQGILTNYTTMLDAQSDYENWNTPLLNIDNQFVSIGYGVDTAMYLYTLRLTPEGEIVSEQRFRSPYHPQDWFIIPYDAAYTAVSNECYILSEVGYYGQ